MTTSIASNHIHDTGAARTLRYTWVDATCVLLLIVYFLRFALAARHGGFREDEMLNLWIYWRAGAFKSLMANIMFWSTFYRPAGALYYLPLYHFFRLDPLPYRIIQISILTAAIPIAYYLARLLTSSRSVAFLAVLGVCYHAALANLVFVGAFIYDVLCGFFYLAALAYYVRLREQDISLSPPKLLIFLLLYVLALNSKEMAVTLPIIILTYEFLKAPHWADYRTFFRWSWRNAMPSLVAGVVTAIYLYGKLYGTGSLTRLDPYRPRYSWHQFVAANAKFLGELFFAKNVVTPETFWIFWVAVFIYAILRRDRTIRLMAVWVVIVPLPLAFLVPIRGGGSLYLLLFGWAMIFAKVACDLIAVISKAVISVGQRITVATGTGERTESDGGGAVYRAHSALGGNSTTGVRVVVFAVLALCFAILTDWQNRRVGNVPALLGVGQKVSHVIAAFDSLNLRPAPHSTVLLKVKEPLFQNKWHSLFIAALVWNDPSVQIAIENLNTLTPEQLAKVNYIISLNEFEATVIRSPGVEARE